MYYLWKFFIAYYTAFYENYILLAITRISNRLVNKNFIFWLILTHHFHCYIGFKCYVRDRLDKTWVTQ